MEQLSKEDIAEICRTMVKAGIDSESSFTSTMNALVHEADFATQFIFAKELFWQDGNGFKQYVSPSLIIETLVPKKTTIICFLCTHQASSVCGFCKKCCTLSDCERHTMVKPTTNTNLINTNNDGLI